MPEVSILPSEIVGRVASRRLAHCRDDFIVGDYMRWEGEPGASLLVHGNSRDQCAIALERIYAGQAVELIFSDRGFVGAKLV